MRPANLIELADRWRVAGREMRRKDPLRFVRHLEALEIVCAEEDEREPAQRLLL